MNKNMNVSISQERHINTGKCFTSANFMPEIHIFNFLHIFYLCKSDKFKHLFFGMWY